ncbi:ABC transporter ATP-binding protein [candidate division WWE3 bacterium]|uniref:ABC transporter ATP-binding protein n=1 Tax=candidate division WWE3 bacterium TaxID=2053526 RepID=A0A7X9DLK4_UNCKA|nr:ABC transporter ATP-binding protein [candidate division WWE3 bacterium]
MPENETPNNNNQDKYQKMSFKQFLRLSVWVVKYVFKIDKKNTLAFLIGGSINSLRPIINTWIFAKLLDVIIQTATKENASITELYPYLAGMFFYNIFASTVSYVTGASRSIVRTKFQALSRKTIYSQVNSIGIQTLEDPEVANKLHRTNMYMQEIFSFFRGIQDTLNNIVSSTGAIIAVATFSPWLALITAVSVLPVVLNDKKYRYMIYKHGYENTEKSRLAYGAFEDLMDSRDLQEIKINSGYSYLDKKFMDFTNWYTGITLRILRKWNLSGYFLDNLSEVILYIGYINIFTRLIAHEISVGSATFYQRMLASLQGNITNIFMMTNDLMETSLRLKDTYELFQVTPSFPDGTKEMSIIHEGPEIEFKNVTFEYPRTGKTVIKNLNLKIKKGEKVAIVGHNGAGKTTMIRLLLRLYRVQQGEILVNGININDLSIDSFYKNSGVLMQEYNTYPYLTARENILIGRSDIPVEEDRVMKAAESADALAFINEFPNKFDQILSEKYKGGIRPSSGQWQKIAIARLFYRDPPLVLFDEPTSSIDAVSEYNIFNRIYEFFNNKTVIIISHRFSTVRNADRIIVIKEGEILEEGTHEQLIALNGEYCKAFLLQAQGYSTTTTIASDEDSENTR